MMHLFNLALFLFVLFIGGECRDFGSVDLPEVSGFVLEKGKPIQLSKDYEGVQIAGLEGTLYSDSLSKLNGVKVLRIKMSKIDSIEKGALCSAPDLEELEINFPHNAKNLTHLTKDTFANCGRLEEILITFSQGSTSYEIDDTAFEDLTNLKKFFIWSYRIKHLKKNFFKLPHSLQEIGLADVDFEEIDSDVFEDFKDLKKIEIRFNNKWSHLPKNLFKNLQKLNTIMLRENGLKNLAWDEFEGLSNVKELDVAANKISSFDAEKIAKYLPNLEIISIELNPLTCKQREGFVQELKEKLGHPLKANYKFDPGFYDSCEED